MAKMIVLALVMLALAGCTPDGGVHDSRNRTYAVDCSSAQIIGSGSCGLTVTGIGWGQ